MPNPPPSAHTAAAATILLVDDEMNILAALHRVLRPLGHHIVTATGGNEGLAVLGHTEVDLVISDMRMPGMDGAEFLERVASAWPETVRFLLTGHADHASTVAAINRGHIYRYISKPWDDQDLVLSVQRALEQRAVECERRRLEALTQNQQEELAALNAGLAGRVAAQTDELRQTLDFLELAHADLKKTYAASVRTLANLLEMREGARAGHARHVAEHAHLLAVQLGMSETHAQDVLFAGLLHDIGKIGLPDELLAKPFETLTPNERALVMKHPVIGAAALVALEPLAAATTLIRAHHERYDGLGYPDGLKGQAIPLGARILAVANDYDALQRGTVAGAPLTPRAARDFLVQNKDKRYDPVVVDAFVAQLGARHEELVSQPVLCIATADLVNGMVLARDLVTDDGVLLLAKDYLLDDALIARLRGLEQTMNTELTIFVRRR